MVAPTKPRTTSPKRRPPVAARTKQPPITSLAEGLLGIAWRARLTDLPARFRLERRKPGHWHHVGRLHTLAPGIALTGRIRFATGGGVDYLTLTGSAVFPDADAATLDASWERVVGPAIDRWLAELGCTPKGGGRAPGVGSARAGSGPEFVGPGGVAAYVVLQERPPVFTIGFLPPSR